MIPQERSRQFINDSNTVIKAAAAAAPLLIPGKVISYPLELAFRGFAAGSKLLHIAKETFALPPTLTPAFAPAGAVGFPLNRPIGLAFEESFKPMLSFKTLGQSQYARASAKAKQSIGKNAFKSKRLEDEYKLLSLIKESVPTLKTPIKHTNQLFLSDYTKLHFEFENARFKGTLLLKITDDSVLYIHRTHWGNNRLLNVPPQNCTLKQLEYVLDEVYSYARKNDLSKVHLAWDSKEIPLATFLEYRDIPINSIGSLPTIESKILTIIETPIPAKSIIKQKTPK